MFNKMPVNPVRMKERQIELGEGCDALWKTVEQKLDQSGDLALVVIDGTHGADFDRFITEWWGYFGEQNYRLETISAMKFVKPENSLRQRFASDITENRAFGRMTEGCIEDYFIQEARRQCAAAIESAKAQPDKRRTLVAVYGTGSHFLTGGGDLNVFLDMSRETQQILHKSTLCNFGFQSNEDALEKYKIAFFVEWPILETYRKDHLSEFDIYVDMNDPGKPVSASVADLLAMVRNIGSGPMRVKPFFAPGVWGGQYLKELADLPSDWENCAWSFEPIAPENSILIGYGDRVIDVPFTVVMSEAYESILGERISGLFGDYFPIRFDYLDTIGGTNLSVQVHPKQRYIRDTFNYILEQQESYYIMEKKEGSKVYLGLTEDCTEAGFLGAVESAQASGTPIVYTDFVKEWVCEKGDLFLIPTGTVHCSGNNNLVLEISSTTWWFTFKIYDYVRKGLDGKPRPINIDHAAANIDWHKKPEWVQKELIQRPLLIGRQGESEEYEIGQRDDLLFYVNRIHLQADWEDDTKGEVMLLNLVEGERVRIESLRQPETAVEFGYAESYILPAVFGPFRIVNLGLKPCKLIKAGVSPKWDVKVIYE